MNIWQEFAQKTNGTLRKVIPGILILLKSNIKTGKLYLTIILYGQGNTAPN